MNKLPHARNTEVVVQDLDKELLIYDLKTNRAYQLNETSKIVFNACDGKQTFDELKRQHKFTADLIYLTLDMLKEKGLLAEDYASPFAGRSRRNAIKKIGLASMVALPVIAGITAPLAVHAASNGRQANNTACTTQAVGTSTECQSGNCVNSLNQFGNRALRCCASSTLGATNGQPGYYFNGPNRAFCTNAASVVGVCCSGAADFDNTATCICL